MPVGLWFLARPMQAFEGFYADFSNLKVEGSKTTSTVIHSKELARDLLTIHRHNECHSFKMA